jgi:hypothetical protein
MQYKFFFTALISSVILFISCEKTPQKGEYKGTFMGKYTTDSISINYTTEYYFDATHSTKKELRLKEKQSQVTSILKKYENDSIAGMIGFGSIYSPSGGSDVKFSTISVHGKYDKKTITGKFSTTFSDGNKEYLSEGDFNISRYSD